MKSNLYNISCTGMIKVLYDQSRQNTPKDIVPRDIVFKNFLSGGGPYMYSRDNEERLRSSFPHHVFRGCYVRDITTVLSTGVDYQPFDPSRGIFIGDAYTALMYAKNAILVYDKEHFKPLPFNDWGPDNWLKYVFTKNPRDVLEAILLV